MVQVKDEIRLIPAYDSPAAEEMPMFAENRVHQRSSGNPYPNKVVMRVDRSHREEKPFRIITLENEFLKVELMPELGGRIYSALDKRTGYDFFYKQHVIKPALIGLLGSWISGGCEFNWPCHHRPSTYMPVDVSIEKHPDGAVTVWMSENEPLNRMKGMVGIHLAPGEARFDTRMKVYNPTPSRHSFLWWENAAVPVNQDYRLIFPPDVKYVQFHYRKNVTSYPVANGVYNGIRMGQGVDISYHKNTHQPTSYFCAPTKYNYFGGYDEGKRCGVIHVADRTVSVGKKMFTWAYNQLSASWENALTDTDGAYAELMASSYSLNQPDFAWLMPYESREFSQMWYPIGAAGIPLCACGEGAFSYEDGKLKLQATLPLENARLFADGKEFTLQADPGKTVELELDEAPALLALFSGEGRCLLRYARPDENTLEPMPETIPDNPTLDKLTTAQELYLLGVHAEQYRDPATRPDGYWREALRRDPEYVPALTALANWELDHFRVEEAWKLAMKAWKKVTVRNFHPESGELQYLLGRISEKRNRPEEAWEWYMQSAWAQDSRARSLTRGALLEGRRGNFFEMVDLAGKALEYQSHNETARLALSVGLKRLGKAALAQQELEALAKYDPLNVTLRALLLGATPGFYQGLESDPAQSVLDAAGELQEMGENELACSLLENLPVKTDMTEYVSHFLLGKLSPVPGGLNVGVAYPSRPLEYAALVAQVREYPTDAKAAGLLGCLNYAAGNASQAAALWERAIENEPENYLHYRNLAVAYFSHLNRRQEALPLLDKALTLKPHDGQLIWEKAHLMHRLRRDPKEIIAFLEQEKDPREDVGIEYCRALNLDGEYEKTIDFMTHKVFTPCEGGEHAVAEQYMFAWHALGRKALQAGDYQRALEDFRKAQVLPQNLGAGLWNDVLLVPHRYYEALCLLRLGDREKALERIDFILMLRQDYFTDMNLPELPCYQAMALRLIGRKAEAQSLLASHVRSQEAAEKAIDPGYKKTTPFFISYMEDAPTLRLAGCRYQLAMAHLAAGEEEEAANLAALSLMGEPTNLYAGLIAGK